MYSMKIDKRLNKIFINFRNQKLFLIFITTASTIMSACIPFFIMNLIDIITYDLNLSKITKLGFIIICLTLLNIILDFVQSYFWNRLRLRSINHLRKVLFEKMLYKSKEYFDKNNPGKILALIMDDSSIVAQNVVIGMPMLVSNIVHLITVSVVLFILSKQLFFVVLIGAPLYVFVFNRLNANIRKTSKSEREHFSTIMSDAQEKINGIDTIKIFQKESFMYKNFSKKINLHLKFICKNSVYQTLGNGLTNTIISLIPVIILLYGSFLISNEVLTLGGLIAFHTYIAYLYEPLMNLSDYNIGIQRSLAVSENILNFLYEDEAIIDGSYDLTTFETLEFDNVSFSYNDKDLVLENLSFKINKGDKVAIKGGSGCGKSTLIKLLLKMYTPTKGHIYINGIDIQDIKRSSLYGIFSIQVQNLFVFDGTVSENISLDSKLDTKKVFESMNIAQLTKSHPFDNLENIINNNSISGGQKQRVCLARTFFKNFEILILDEPTASLDSEIESNLKIILESMVENKTLILTSHRPCLLELCNKEINLELCEFNEYYLPT